MNAIRFFWMLTLISALSGCFVWSGIEDTDETKGGDRTIPTRPPAETSSDDDSHTLSLAAYDIEMIQEGDRWREIGFNIDNVETYAPGDPTSCNPPQADADPPEDGHHGIDNQFGSKVTPLLKLVLPTAICEMSGSHFEGYGTFIASIEKWNGTPTDARITAYVTSAVGGVPTPDGVEPDPESLTWIPREDGDGYELLINDEPVKPPCFDGNDYFYPSSHEALMRDAGADGSRTPRVMDTDAYIVDNVVVARVPIEHPLTIMSLFRSLPARISGGYIIAKLDENYDRVVEGTLVGRFLQNNIVDVAPNIGACDELLLNPFRSIIRSAVDVMADPTRDHMGETCDAISVGIQFKAIRVNVATGTHPDWGPGLGPAWGPPQRCAFEAQWDAEDQEYPVLYDCSSPTSVYDWGEEWKKPGRMDHCVNGTLLTELLD